MCVANRKVPAAIVTIFSSIIVLLSLVMAILAIRFNTQGITSSLGEFDDYTNSAFLILLTSAIVALLSGIFGLFLYCCKNRFCAVMFGCLLLPSATAVFCFGLSIGAISNTSEETLHQFCKDDPNYQAENDSKYIQRARLNVAQVDKTMGDFVNLQMCSPNCPCFVTPEIAK